MIFASFIGYVIKVYNYDFKTAIINTCSHTEWTLLCSSMPTNLIGLSGLCKNNTAKLAQPRESLHM